MKTRRIISLSLLMSGLLFSNPQFVHANPSGSHTSQQVSTISEIDSIIEFAPGQHTAFDIYQDLLEASITLKAQSFTSPDARVNITFGAEKEASSFLITKVMGPNREALLSHFEQETSEFIRDFIKRFVSGSSRNKMVIDKNGINHTLTTEELLPFLDNLDQLNDQKLLARLDKMLRKMGKSPYSHLTEIERKHLFKKEVPGQTNHFGGKFYWNYDMWEPILGIAEKYISDAHGTFVVGGWEINFAPMQSYGEFEELIKWFKETLQNAGKLFQAPGHQRIVFPEPRFKGLRGNRKKEAMALWIEKSSEMFRSVQAFIIARGIVGNTGIEKANFKAPHFDENLILGANRNNWNGGDTGRGVIRYDAPNRFVKNTYSIELRAGTKDPEVQQFVEQLITARIGSNQLGDFANISSYSLYPLELAKTMERLLVDEGARVTLASQISERFGINQEVTTNFAKNISSIGKINRGYFIPIWHWNNAPYMQGKAQILKVETIRFIETVASSTDEKTIQDALKRWTKNIHLNEALENYLRPKAYVENMAELSTFKSTGEVDVNKVDLGIEYSGRFTNAYATEMSSRGIDGQQVWLNTTDGMTPHERKQAVKRMAIALGKALNDGRVVPVTDATSAGAHGHGLSVAFNFFDKHGRKWRAEWDGVGRNYTADGKVVQGSQRGGHIEIVTPKFIPTYEDMNAVFTAMDREGVIPSLRAGGGHINIDLAPFIGKPREMARFLAIFHEHRGILSFMFQNINRSAAAEAVEVSEKLRTQLRDFNGTETELKQLLYNERYFNQRIGRKTRNMQIDMSAFFQDVIPAEYLHEDFDMKNPTDPWREQFRVEPHIRKMEMRMFDAPLDAFESSMQIKVVRALMNAALNETGELTGTVQNVDHVAYAQDYDRAEADMERMCEALGLNAKEYKIFLARASVQANQAISSRLFRTYEDKIELYGWKKSTGGWGEALKYERPSSRAIGSSGRHWHGSESQMAKEFKELRVEAARKADLERSGHSPSPSTRPALQIGVNCRQVFGI